MLTNVQKIILSSLLHALSPIARMLLRAGIGYREFSEIAKTAFVDVATSDYGIRGRPTNVSRVAAMTGLTRKEIKRLRDKLRVGNASEVYKIVPVSDVLHFWYTDSEYLDQRGRPLAMAFDGPSPSFTSLVKKYGGDIPPGAMRTELKRAGAVEESDKGILKVLGRSFCPSDSTDKVIEGLRAIGRLSATVAHNVDAGEERSETFVQRTIETRRWRPDDHARLRRITADRLSEYTNAIDDLFGAYDSVYPEGQGRGLDKIGVGLYYFED